MEWKERRFFMGTANVLNAGQTPQRSRKTKGEEYNH